MPAPITVTITILDESRDVVEEFAISESEQALDRAREIRASGYEEAQPEQERIVEWPSDSLRVVVSNLITP